MPVSSYYGPWGGIDFRVHSPIYLFRTRLGEISKEKSYNGRRHTLETMFFVAIVRSAILASHTVHVCGGVL
jgi:hypothetical protein